MDIFSLNCRAMTSLPTSNIALASLFLAIGVSDLNIFIRLADA